MGQTKYWLQVRGTMCLEDLLSIIDGAGEGKDGIGIVAEVSIDGVDKREFGAILVEP